MKRIFLVTVLLFVQSFPSARAESLVSEVDVLNDDSDESIENKHATKKDIGNEDNQEDTSFFDDLLLYLPNRIFDLLDIIKARVRLGPGVSVGAQVTKPISFFVGGHTDIYLGLPGPRLERTIPIPVGAEAVAGASISVLDATTNRDTAKDKDAERKSFSEISVELQLIIVGLEIGIDPVEILDALSGIIFIDLRDDDL